MTFIRALLLLALAAPQEAPVEGVRLLTPAPKRHEKVEFAWTPPAAPANPFDPSTASLEASVTGPSGKTFRVPGFWYQDFRRSLKNPEAKGEERVEVLEPQGAPEWRVRFSSGETGDHAVVLEVREGQGVRKSAPQRVAVAAGPSGGMVRVSPRNPRFLEDESGKPFFALGQNQCMYPGREGISYYERVLPKLAAQGANYVRLWQEYYVQGDLKRPAGPGDGSNTGFPLETVLTGLGRYDLACAWRLDAVADLCEKLGISWQLTFEQVVWFNRKHPHRWKRNPYNAENQGPCAVPADYLTSPVCRDLSKRRARYSVARWGWTPRLVAWEFWNEVDNLDGFDPKANADWHRDLGKYVRSIDPWKHLTTTSWRDREMFSLPEIDVVQAHLYCPLEHDIAEYCLLDTNHLMAPYGKPFFFGEQGIDNGFDLDSEGRRFHEALWSTALSGAAGAGMSWWWNNYIDKHDLYRHYAGVSKFIKGVDWPAHAWKPVKISRPSLPCTLRVYGLAAPDRALVWIHDPLAFQVKGGKAEKGPSQEKASLNVTGPDEGMYRIEWVDTMTGEPVGKDQQPLRPLRHFGYGIELNPPPFWGDIAARITRVK
jgi:hypothetical protein